MPGPITAAIVAVNSCETGVAAALAEVSRRNESVVESEFVELVNALALAHEAQAKVTTLALWLLQRRSAMGKPVEPVGEQIHPAISVGKPDAGNPHVRFDERGRETEQCRRGPSTNPAERRRSGEEPL